MSGLVECKREDTSTLSETIKQVNMKENINNNNDGLF